jgi:succinoglycan biosynthesis protein ExoU
MDFDSFVRGRRVAVVGPSRSLVGSGSSGEIDAHDLVVRLNHGWPVPEPLHADLGRRIDVLYHCCNGDVPIGRVFAGGVDRLRWACYEKDRDTPALLAACRRDGVDTLDVTGVYTALRERLRTYPNTGLVAIHHLLDAGAAGVAIFGMTFFREPYRDGYPGDGAAAANWPADGSPPARIWNHDLDVQYRHFADLCRREPRLSIDPASLAKMPEVRSAVAARDAGRRPPIGGDDGHDVAVVIACHEASRFIGRAVRSALLQPEAAEVIVVDDASTDGSLAAAAAADDGSGRLTLLRQEANRGPAAARNRGMTAARAPWLAILDADDFLLPGRLAGMLRHAADADVVADDPLRVREEAIDGPREPVLGLERPRRVTFAEFVAGNIARPGRPRREWGYVKPLLRRRVLDEQGLRYREELRLGEDYEFYARSIALGARVLVIPAQGYVSVWREDSLSGRHEFEDLCRLRDCDAALAALPGLAAADLAALRRHATDIECRVQWRRLRDAIATGEWLRAAACFAEPWPIPGHLLRLLFWRLRRRLGIPV